MTTAGQHFPNKPEIIFKAFSNLGPASGCFSVSLTPYSGYIPLPDFGWNLSRNACARKSFSMSPGSHTSQLVLWLQRLGKAKFSSFRWDMFLSPLRMELRSKTSECEPMEYKAKVIINCSSNPLTNNSSVSRSFIWIFFASIWLGLYFSKDCYR